GTMLPDDHDAADPTPRKANAGVIFVLKSRGSWWHSGYHITAAIVAPALLSLPLAVSLMGWIGGSVGMGVCAIVSFYSYNLLSIVLDHNAHQGRRLLRFSDVAHHLMGPRWAAYFVAPIQVFAICYGSTVGGIILSGQSLQLLYHIARPNGSMQLYQFIVIIGGICLIFGQMPSFHSLRHMNLVSLILAASYSVCVTVAAVYVGRSKDAPKRDYAVVGGVIDRVFGVFNGIAIMGTSFGNGMLPEIQATIAPPVVGKMFKGLLMAYCAVIFCFFSVSFSGYWAFGNQSQGVILSNFINGGGVLLVPKWFLVITTALVFLQGIDTYLVYLQPINVVLDNRFSDPTGEEFSRRNVASRLISRSAVVVSATLLAAMLPFFGDFAAVLGASGYIPLDFVLPMIFYNITFKHRTAKGRIVYWINVVIAAIFTAVAAVGVVASIRQIVLDSGTYRLFANV
ncbi:hypothetical protein M569_07636, partial [Genlisea aurea]